MKKQHVSPRGSRGKKVVCTVSAAALMLGVSSAATIGINFQESYCGAAGYTGFPVTMTAFGVPAAGWESLTEMPNGYGGCSGPLGYTFSESVDTTTSGDGLNPLAHGALAINWFGPTANFANFGGYSAPPPHYNYGGGYPNSNVTPSGEAEIYATFIRDGINFGPGSNGGDNDQPGYYVDITGLQSVFTNSPFVVELIASSDSLDTLTNAFVIDVTGKVTNSVTYPSIPPVDPISGVPWVRGQGGGLSTVSAPLTTYHLYITSNHPQHSADDGWNHAGTISGFIITDKPVVSMSPQPVVTHPGDSVTLNPYAIGVPPLSYQWRRNGVAIPGATSSSYTIASVSAGTAGVYDLLVTNQYGSATSASVNIPAGVSQGSVNNVIVDSNPSITEHDGIDQGATWAASSSDGTRTRSGVMQFSSASSNGVSITATTNFIGSTGTVAFWMRSAGTDPNSGTAGAAPLFAWSAGSVFNDWVFGQQDDGTLLVNCPGNGNYFTSQANVSDNKWHFIAFTFDQTDSGGVSLYVDGQLDTTNANSQAWSAPSSTQITLGYSTDKAWEYYNGSLDDVRFYNTIVSAANISSIYSSDAVAQSGNLVSRFNFDAAPGKAINLTWPASAGVLQSATQVNGPYQDVPNSGAPYIVAPGAAQRFFRLRYLPYTPAAITSNPYLM